MIAVRKQTVALRGENVWSEWFPRLARDKRKIERERERETREKRRKIQPVEYSTSLSIERINFIHHLKSWKISSSNRCQAS